LSERSGLPEADSRSGKGTVFSVRDSAFDDMMNDQDEVARGDDQCWQYDKEE
jgi:hypothetical protein